MKAISSPVSADLTVNMIEQDGHIGVHMLKHGIQVFRVVLLNAARDIPKARIAQYGAVAPDLGFTIGDVFEQIGTTLPQ